MVADRATATGGVVLSLVDQASVVFGGRTGAATWTRETAHHLLPFLVAGYRYLAGRRAASPGWGEYLRSFHTERPGITESLLASTARGGGPDPYEWLTEPLRGTGGPVHGPVLDLACGSAPTRRYLPDARWLGIDTSAAELARAAAAGRGPLIRARADALPLAGDAVDAVVAAMCLQVVTPLDDVLAEVRRVLRPGGTLLALVPSARPSARGLLTWWRVLRALGVRALPWPNPQARDGLPKLLRAHGFTVESSTRRAYVRPLTDAAEAALLIDGLYLPGVDDAHIAAAKRALASRARPGRGLPIPLRRVVARAPT